MYSFQHRYDIKHVCSRTTFAKEIQTTHHNSPKKLKTSYISERVQNRTHLLLTVNFIFYEELKNAKYRWYSSKINDLVTPRKNAIPCVLQNNF